MKRISQLLLTFGGVGYLPGPSGTWGSLVTVAPLFLLPASVSIGNVAAVGAVVATVVGIPACRWVPVLFGREDPGPVVLDETAGMLLSIAFLPATNAAWLVAAFFLFRLFDITKPFPARRAERLPGGYGIFLDDLVAGLYTNALLRIAHALTSA